MIRSPILLTASRLLPRTGRLLPRTGRLRRLLARLGRAADAGMTTAEYAVGTVAACGFAALLWTVLHSATVQHALTGLITRALGAW